jgi:hypothetical protein
MLVGLLLLQVAAGPPIPPELRKRVPRVVTSCPVQPDAGGEIVVCGRPTEHRLETLPEPVASARQEPLSFRLPGGGKGSVQAIRTQLPGAIGQGAAVTLRIPFGGSRRE